MASKTLHAILTHWKTEIHPGEELNYIELPFNIENFCRENDQALREAEARGLKLGMEQAAQIAREVSLRAEKEIRRLMPIKPSFAIAQTAKESPHE